MLLLPLTTGFAVGIMAGGRVTPILPLTFTIMTLFWLRTPLESWLGVGTVRAQTPAERTLARNVSAFLGAASICSLCGLFWQGRNISLLLLGLIAAIAFGAQLGLKKLGRATRIASEIIGALALTATAPAAYYVTAGKLDMTAWTLWLVNWLFAADQVHYVWVKIRGSRAAGWKSKWSVGWSFMAGQVAMAGVLYTTCYLAWLPRVALLAFVPILIRGSVWFVANPKPIIVRRLGWSELAHAVTFATLLIAAFRWTEQVGRHL